MRVVVHMSDLHFGRVHRPLLEPLVRAVREIGPDVVAVSGDLTQRARRSEFKEAQSFLSSLPGPGIVVPGNHDIPLHNPVLRFFFPLARFRRYITRDLAPLYADDEIAVLGANTARALVARGGRINIAQVQGICRSFSEFEEQQMKVLVTHHPFDLPEGFSKIHLVGRSRMAMESFARCGADLFLSGHLHIARAGNTTRYQIHGFTALVVHAGTVISTRQRGELNSFNLIRITPPRIAVETHTWQSDSLRFACSQVTCFERSGAEWMPV